MKIDIKSIFLGLIYNIIWLYKHVKETAIKNTEYASNTTMTVTAIIGIVFYPAFYITWKYILPEPYESLLVRSIAVILFVGFLVRDHWPERYKKWLPLYWHASLTYGLPFFQTYLLLMNNFSNTLVSAQGIAFFIVVILFVDWIIIILMYLVGISSAFIVYIILTGNTNFLGGYIHHLPLFIFAIIAGFLLNYSQKSSQAYNERIQAMFSTGTNIAHELRTPLATIRNHINGFKKYLPPLVAIYKNNSKKNDDVIKIPDDRLEILQDSLDVIIREIEYSNEVISAILINTNANLLGIKEPAVTTIKRCINLSIDRYPFKNEQKESIHIEGPDFEFSGYEILVNQIIQNLMRNAFYYIKKAHKGEIFITTELGKHFNYMHFKDTAEGIKPDQVKRIFNRFYTTRFEGTGIGLSFCKEAIESMNGNITCSSVYGEFTEFTLSFPKIG